MGGQRKPLDYKSKPDAFSMERVGGYMGGALVVHAIKEVVPRTEKYFKGCVSVKLWTFKLQICIRTI